MMAAWRFQRHLLEQPPNIEFLYRDNSSRKTGIGWVLKCAGGLQLRDLSVNYAKLVQSIAD